MQPKAPFLSVRSMRWIVLTCVILIMGGWLTWNQVLTSWESRKAGDLLLQIYDRYQDGERLDVSLLVKPGAVSPTIPAEISLQYPDRFQLTTEVDKVSATVTRNQGELWIHAPSKKYGLIGKADLPKFTGFPDSVEAVDLPDMGLPITRGQLQWAPVLLRVEHRNGAWEVEPSDLGQRMADLPDFKLRLELDEIPVQGWPHKGDAFQVTLELPGQPSFTGQLHGWGFADPGDIKDWELHAPKEHTVETVALAHLVRCIKSLPEQMLSKPPTLGTATGERELVARSGKGRLELHDGVRVLFLEGTPEEMGTQHGQLLGDEVRRMTERILYGVGVASSFEKQRWFIGEIEEAQSRIQPFVRDEHIREMDALAQATGMHIQEARLMNFFPELFHCSGFALHGKATLGGQMYHGRILDYMRGVGLEENAVVMICKPEGANAWVNVSYAGFLGSVTAMNEKQIAIGEMGGRGEGDWDGKPMAQLVREVMENCDTIDEAVELMRSSPRTCEYYYVISDAKSMRAVGIKATPDIFETVWSGETHPQLPHAVEDAVVLSADDRYEELVKRVKAGYGTFEADSARELMTRPVCMTSNIQSVLFAPGTLDFWVANADGENVASHTRYTHFNLEDLLGEEDS